MKRFFNLLNRLKVPFTLVIASAAFYALTELQLLPDRYNTERWQSVVNVASQVCLILAFGWAITTIIDSLISRRVSKLNHSEADNLYARKTQTRLDVLRRIWILFGALATLGAALTAIPAARQIGVSLFASAGIAGIAVGIAARPVLSNLIAGLQIAFTQPIRLDDVVIVEGEWGRIEEIDLFYVVVRIWDLRRLVVPLSYFIETPFENWSRRTTQIIGQIYWSLDYLAPIDAMREKLNEFVEEDRNWDGETVGLVVTDATGDAITVRAIASAANSTAAWDLRCAVREKMISWLQAEHPEALPRLRAEGSISAVPDRLVEAVPEPPKQPAGNGRG